MCVLETWQVVAWPSGAVACASKQCSLMVLTSWLLPLLMHLLQHDAAAQESREEA